MYDWVLQGLGSLTHASLCGVVPHPGEALASSSDLSSAGTGESSSWCWHIPAAAGNSLVDTCAGVARASIDVCTHTNRCRHTRWLDLRLLLSDNLILLLSSTYLGVFVTREHVYLQHTHSTHTQAACLQDLAHNCASSTSYWRSASLRVFQQSTPAVHSTTTDHQDASLTFTLLCDCTEGCAGPTCACVACAWCWVIHTCVTRTAVHALTSIHICRCVQPHSMQQPSCVSVSAGNMSHGVF
jgi:hypothetical protein